MRLLDVHTFPPPAPEDKYEKRKYAILSHTWRNEEITLSDLRQPDAAAGKAGWSKIHQAQQQAIADRYDHLWIDTCCIDKSSSAELGETINSMYRYYQEAEVCYVYLDDLEDCPLLTDEDSEAELHDYWYKKLQQCRWFRRGWTLQELLAPKRVFFYDRNWSLIGTLSKLVTIMSRITNIHLDALHHSADLASFSVAQRMSWAAGRETTRPEDKAYSLLGILDINLDVRYGESTRAFIRLQQEIIQQSTDQSLFAWNAFNPVRLSIEDLVDDGGNHHAYSPWEETQLLLATSPDAFGYARDVVPLENSTATYSMTNRGLRITASMVIDEGGRKAMVLPCRFEHAPTCIILLYLWQELAPPIYHQDAIHEYYISPPNLSPYSRLTIYDMNHPLKPSGPETIIIRRKGPPYTSRLSISQWKLWLQLRLKKMDESVFYLFSKPASIPPIARPPSNDDVQGVDYVYIDLEGFNNRWLDNVYSSFIRLRCREKVVTIYLGFGSNISCQIGLDIQEIVSETEVSDLREPAGDIEHWQSRVPSLPKGGVEVKGWYPVSCASRVNQELTVAVKVDGEWLNDVWIHVVTVDFEQATAC